MVSSHTRPWDGFPFTPNKTWDFKQVVDVLFDMWVSHNKTSASIQGQDQIIPSNGCLMCADLGRKKNEPEGRAAKVLNSSPKTWVRAQLHRGLAT